jgi:hypothetical protein
VQFGYTLQRKHRLTNIRNGLGIVIVTGILALSLLTMQQLIQIKSEANEPQKIATPVAIAATSVPTAVLGQQTTQINSPTPLPPTPTLVPKRNALRFGVAVDDYANSNGGLASIEQMVGKQAATVSIFKHFGLPGNTFLRQEDLAYIKNHGMRLLVAWEPWNPQNGLQQATDYLQEVADGKQDGYIKEFAKGVKEYASPVTIRFGHEMNGNWYPWGQRADTYKAAYRKIVTLFKEEGVSNARWMWSINAENVPVTSISTVRQFYPGSDVVDEIGIDGFNFGEPWRSFSSIFSPAYAVAASYGKPISISETASSETGGNKPQWIREMFSTLNTQFPLVQEVIWFNIQKEKDWRLDSSPSSKEAFKAGI